jgi:hypothetical protein
VYTHSADFIVMGKFEENRNMKCCEIQEDNSSVLCVFSHPEEKKIFGENRLKCEILDYCSIK